MTADNTATGQVEVGVVRQVDRRRPVGGSLVIDAHPVSPGQGVGHSNLQPAGIALLTVGTGVSKPHSRIDAGGGLTVPEPLVEADVATMDVVGAEVASELVDGAIELESACRDAIGHAPDDTAHVGHVRLVIGDLVVAQDHVLHGAVPAAHVQFGNGCA